MSAEAQKFWIFEKSPPWVSVVRNYNQFQKFLQWFVQMRLQKSVCLIVSVSVWHIASDWSYFRTSHSKSAQRNFFEVAVSLSVSKQAQPRQTDNPQGTLASLLKRNQLTMKKLLLSALWCQYLNPLKKSLVELNESDLLNNLYGIHPIFWWFFKILKNERKWLPWLHPLTQPAAWSDRPRSWRSRQTFSFYSFSEVIW